MIQRTLSVFYSGTVDLLQAVHLLDFFVVTRNGFVQCTYELFTAINWIIVLLVPPHN